MLIKYGEDVRYSADGIATHDKCAAGPEPGWRGGEGRGAAAILRHVAPLQIG